MTGERWPAGPVSGEARRRFDDLVARRAAREPLQYVIGQWGFRTLDLMVDQRVLIPRPETEQVVEVALAELDRRGARSVSPEPLPSESRSPEPESPESRSPESRSPESLSPESRSPESLSPESRSPASLAPASLSPDSLIAVDLGTGSGAIALALVTERAGVEVWATDVSEAALAVASANLNALGGRSASRVHLALGSWWTALPGELRGRVDLVVSNPPYIASAEMSQLDAEVVGWEPRLALEAGPTGLEAVRDIVGEARAWLRPAGVAVIELAPHQSGQGAAVARAAGFAAVDIRPDLAGRDRILVAQAG